MALESDPYVVLGVPRDASGDQIAQARRRLSRKYHPDVNLAPDAAARFDEVQQAFQLLSDPAARSRYDRARDEQRRARVVDDPRVGYGPAAERPRPRLVPEVPHEVLPWLVAILVLCLLLVLVGHLA